MSASQAVRLYATRCSILTNDNAMHVCFEKVLAYKFQPSEKNAGLVTQNLEAWKRQQYRRSALDMCRRGEDTLRCRVSVSPNKRINNLVTSLAVVTHMIGAGGRDRRL